jgi:hypothetical protein
MSYTSALLLEDAIDLRIQEKEALEAEDDLAIAKVRLAALDSKHKDYASAEDKVNLAKAALGNLRRTLRNFTNAAKKRYEDHIAKGPATNPLGAQGSGSGGAPVNVVKEMKIKEPTAFKGNMADYSRFYFEVTNVLRIRTSIDTDVKRIAYIGSLLSESALTWYQLWIASHSTQNVITASFKTFKDDFESAFKDPSEVSNNRRKLAQMRQESMDFNEYAIAFRNVCTKADFPIDSQIETFKATLSRQSLSSWHPSEMPETYEDTVKSIRMSLEIYKSIQASMSSSSPNRTPYKAAPQGPFTPQGRQPISSDPKKIGIFVSSPEAPTYQQRIKDGVCTRCGMSGHYAVKCQNYPLSAPPGVNREKSMKLFPRAFNHMEDSGQSSRDQKYSRGGSVKKHSGRRASSGVTQKIMKKRGKRERRTIVKIVTAIQPILNILWVYCETAIS